MSRLPEMPHLNAAEHLPPVGCPLLIQTPEGLVRAERTSHIENRQREMEYRTETGALLTGRFAWTYP